MWKIQEILKWMNKYETLQRFLKQLRRFKNEFYQKQPTLKLINSSIQNENKQQRSNKWELKRISIDVK